MPSTPITLAQRIELAEAFVELSWLRYQQIPPGRGWHTERQAEALRAAEMASIDAMLDQMLGMYDLRALSRLEGVA